jgi:hypothetical protein
LEKRLFARLLNTLQEGEHFGIAGGEAFHTRIVL